MVAAGVHKMRKNHRRRLRSETGLDVAVIGEGAPGGADDDCAAGFGGATLGAFLRGGSGTGPDRGGDDIFCMMSCSSPISRWPSLPASSAYSLALVSGVSIWDFARVQCKLISG